MQMVKDSRAVYLFDVVCHEFQVRRSGEPSLEKSTSLHFLSCKEEHGNNIACCGTVGNTMILYVYTVY